MPESSELDIQQIREILPQRYPFLLVDRILEIVPGERAVGVKNVTGNEEFFQGHFPNQPVMPGVLVTEAMTQVVSLLLSLSLSREGKEYRFTTMDKVRFRRPVIPGDQLITQATIVSLREEGGKAKMRSTVNGEVAAEGEIHFVCWRDTASPGSVSSGSVITSTARRKKRDSVFIHPTSFVDPEAELGVGVEVGPYCIIEGGVVLGDYCRIESHAVIKRGTTLGERCVICPNVILGHVPQDLKFGGEESFLHIGNRNVFREGATVHRATGEGNVTRLGDDNLFMAYSHVGHNCTIGSGLLVANYTGISGHVVIEDRVVIGGMVGIHQFVHVGQLAMLAGYARISQDVPPFMMAAGDGEIVGLNVVGLRRAGIDQETRNDLKKAHRYLFRSNLNTTQAMELIEREIRPSPELEYLLSFLRRIRAGRGGRQEEASKHQEPAAPQRQSRYG